MKKALKVLGIIAGIIILLVIAFFAYNLINTHKTLNEPRLPDK